MNHLISTFIWVVLFVLVSCEAPEKKDVINGPESTDSLHTDYATGFSAVRKDSIWYLTIHSPYPEAARSFRYLLVPRGQAVPTHGSDVQLIRTPVKQMIATSTTHIPLLDYLDATETLTGFPTPDYISSSAMRARIDSGGVRNVGRDNALEPEIILDLNPDMIMAYSMNADLSQMERLRKTGIPYILNGDYLEPHPLGRAEWIRVAGLLLGKERMADSVFSQIRDHYLEIKREASQINEKPTALSGIVYGDTWFMPGGRNYAARLMEDAAIQYIWSENESTGFLELSFEAVLDKARDADLWIGVASVGSLRELESTEPRYSMFRAFREKSVFTYNRRIGPTGGNEYLELGYLRPDLILADLVHLAHPDVLSDHSMYFYNRLE